MNELITLTHTCDTALNVYISSSITIMITANEQRKYTHKERHIILRLVIKPKLVGTRSEVKFERKR